MLNTHAIEEEWIKGSNRKGHLARKLKAKRLSKIYAY